MSTGENMDNSDDELKELAPKSKPNPNPHVPVRLETRLETGHVTSVWLRPADVRSVSAQEHRGRVRSLVQLKDEPRDPFSMGGPMKQLLFLVELTPDEVAQAIGWVE